MQITCAALPRAPAATTVTPHWLFIDGQQPATEENAPVDRPAAKRQRTEADGSEAGRAGAAAKDAAGQKRKGGGCVTGCVVLAGCRGCRSVCKWAACRVRGLSRFPTGWELMRQGWGVQSAR